MTLNHLSRLKPRRAAGIIFEMALVAAFIVMGLSFSASFFFESKQREDYAALWLRRLAKAHSKGGIPFQCNQREAPQFHPREARIYFDPYLKLSEISEGQLGGPCPSLERSFEAVSTEKTE